MAGIYREYLIDLAPQGTGAFPMLQEVGHTEPDQLANWFADSTTHPLVIVQESHTVGFALVRRQAQHARAGKAGFMMAEFFVARAFRRRGIGLAAVRLIFDRYAGSWHIMEYQRNQHATEFWRRAVRVYTGGKFQERVQNGEVHQYFESNTRA
jgi:predicted acetyltransferase